jgi:hypothetical protein
MKFIKLTQGKETIVDDEDYENLNQWKWHYHNQGYAKRTLKKKNKTTKIYMHRFIMNLNSNLTIDHINGNGLDNRKCNLRIANKSENSMNSNKQTKLTSSIYKGVTWHKQCKKWVAQIGHKRKHYSLGLYLTEKEAALAYNKKAKELFGEFALLNKVEND